MLFRSIDPDIAPRYRLGSTRLAAFSKFGAQAVKPEEYETEDIIQKALKEKSTFGDLDIDVAFTAEPKDIIKAIVDLDPSAYAGMSQGKQVNLAIKDKNKVYQVDLVDISHGRGEAEFLEKSSFLDLNNKIKGAFSLMLLRAIAAAKPVDKEQSIQSIINSAQQNPESRLGTQINKELKNGWEPFNLRFSLGINGIILALDFRKEGTSSTKKVNIDDMPRVGFENLNNLAQSILDSENVTGATIYHATKLAEFVRDNKTPQEKQRIWSLFVTGCEQNLKRGLAKEDYEAGMSKIAEIMDIQSQAPQKINEGRVGIGRFVGKNEFNKATAFDLLRQIVISSNAEGKAQFEIDLAENPSIDLVKRWTLCFVTLVLIQITNILWNPAIVVQYFQKLPIKSLVLAPISYSLLDI